ncbi:sugar-binding protein, partial [Xanthomonas oryzae pv. oryzae]
AYTGVRQYEAEHFDFQRIGSLVANGVSGAVRNYQGLGYVDVGGNPDARLRTTINMPQAGTYTLATRYSAVGASVGTVDLYVNGMRVGTPAFAQTSSASEWASSPLTATLNAGDNVVEYRASAGAQVKLYLDNLAVAQ